MAEFGALYIVSIKCSVLTEVFSAHRSVQAKLYWTVVTKSGFSFFSVFH